MGLKHTRCAWDCSKLTGSNPFRLNTVVFTRSTSMLGVILEDNATVVQLRVENFIMNDYGCNIRR